MPKKKPKFQYADYLTSLCQMFIKKKKKEKKKSHPKIILAFDSPANVTKKYTYILEAPLPTPFLCKFSRL